MYDDRPPRTIVVVDEYNDAEEMEVRLSFHEAVTYLRSEDEDIDLTTAKDVEPWVRVRFGADYVMSSGVTVIPDEDDQV